MPQASELSSVFPARSQSKQDHSRQKGAQLLNKYSPREASEPEKQRAHHSIDRPSTATYKKDERIAGSTTVSDYH